MIVDVPGLPLRRRDGTVGYALVDAEDFVWLNSWRWGTNSNGYVHRYDRLTKSPLALHRVIMGLEKGDPHQVDHRNGDRLDNRRGNLRVVTVAQNRQNLTVFSGRSRFRGVYFSAKAGRWAAQCKLDRRSYHLGTFDSEEEAAVAAAAWRREHMPFSAEAAA